MTAYFLNLECITASGRTARSTRTYDRYAHVCLKALDARNEAAMQSIGGGSADTPTARTPRRSPATAKAKNADGGADEDGHGSASRYSMSAVAHEGFSLQTADGRRARRGR